MTDRASHKSFSVRICVFKFSIKDILKVFMLWICVALYELNTLA